MNTTNSVIKEWIDAKLYALIGTLVASIPTVDLFFDGGMFDELYGYAVAGLVAIIIKFRSWLNG